MIRSYKLELSPAEGKRITPSDAYRLYSWLLSQIPSVSAERLHEQQLHPISQHICYCPDTKKPSWNVSLLTDESIELFSPVLELAERIELHSGIISIGHREKPEDLSFKDIVLKGRKLHSRYTRLQIVTACSFKQTGQYMIFPQEKLILQSLVNRWNSFCPDLTLDDQDALDMLTERIYISDYDLRSVRYKLKNSYIPGFAGKLTISSQLPVPLQELWGSLLYWSQYSGIGIKTALGMGGIKLLLSADDML